MAGDSLRRILGGAYWYLLEKVFRLVGAFLIGAWVARHIGPQNYGMLSYSLAIVATLSFLGSWSVETLVVRDLVREPEKQASIVTTYFAVRLFGSLAVPVLAAAYVVVLGGGDRQLLLLTLVSSVTIVCGAFDVADCWLQARHRARSTSMVRSIGYAFSAGTKICLVLVNAGVVWFAVAGVLEAIVMACMYFAYLRSEGLVPSSQSFDPSEVRRLFSDGKLMMLSGLTVVVYSKIDILAAGSLLTKEAVGAYAMAATMAAAWNMVGMSLGQAWAPHVSASRAAGNESYVRTLRRLLITALLLSVAGSIFLSSISGFIFDLLLGGRFAGSVHLFSILVWSSVPVFLGIATSQIIVNNNIYWVSLLRTATGMIISLALVVPVTSAWGAEGVAFLVVLSACITVIGILFSRSARVTLSRVLGFA